MIRKHYSFSVEDYERMYEGGMLDENDRVELIRGDVLEKMIIGDAHAACVDRLNRMFSRCLSADQALVAIQNPIRLPLSVPEPDVVIAIPRADDYAEGRPTPAEILLLIEVADTSLEFDRTTKLLDYAESGVREYWIVNLPDRCLEIHTGPQSDGTYSERRVVQSGSVTMTALPNHAWAVSEILR